ncbi:MAG: alpha/beta hydrolase [Lysobacteraceae bacterium]
MIATNSPLSLWITNGLLTMSPAGVERFILFRVLAKPALYFLLVLGLCYGGIIAYLYSHQRQLIYLPQYTRQPVIDTNFSVEVDGLSLKGWVVNAGKRDVLIYFGGNGEAVQRNLADFRQRFPDRSSYLVPYRGYGPNAGEPSQDALFADALRLFDSVKARHPDGRIAVVGRSLGTGVASYVASRRDIERLVLVTPFDSMVSMAGARYPWLPIDWMLEERFESDRFLSGLDVPLLLLRAGRDEVIPPAATDRLIASLPKTPDVIRFPNARHNDVDGFPGYWPAIAEFLGNEQDALRLPDPAPGPAEPRDPAPVR